MTIFTVLYIFTDVGGCECHVSTRTVYMDVAFWYFSNYLSSSTLVVDAMTFLIILNSTGTRPFYGCISVIGLLYFCLSKKYPPSLMCASVYDMYNIYEYIWRIITLLLYSVTVSGCVAL